MATQPRVQADNWLFSETKRNLASLSPAAFIFLSTFARVCRQVEKQLDEIRRGRSLVVCLIKHWDRIEFC